MCKGPVVGEGGQGVFKAPRKASVAGAEGADEGAGAEVPLGDGTCRKYSGDQLPSRELGSDWRHSLREGGGEGSQKSRRRDTG